MTKYVGTVLEEDKNKIIDIHEKKIALDNLKHIIGSNNQLLDKLKLNYKEMSLDYDNWFAQLGTKYQFESSENGQWQVDFSTGEVYLVQ